MATFKIVLPHFDRKTESGNHSVAIRLIQNRKKVYIKTNAQVSAKQMNRKGEITDPRVLVALNRRIMDFQADLLDMGAAADGYTAEELRDLLLRKETVRNMPVRQGIAFLSFWRDEFLPTVHHEWTRKVYVTSLNRFSEFVRMDDINTSMISLKFVRDYEEWLRKKGVGARGINIYLTHLKRVFNEAKMTYNDDDVNLIVIPNNPFAKYKVPPSPPAKKEGALTREQLLSIINAELSGNREQLARDCFVMSLFLAGINSADLYNAGVESLSKKWVFEYERTKTRTRRLDQAVQRITVPEYLRPLFEQYRDRTEKRLLNFHVRYMNHREFNRAINQGLKQIGDRIGIPGLYYYQARHSFASIAHNRLRYSLNDVGKCLTHVPLMRVTDGYVEQDYSIVDEVNGAVLRYVLNGKGEKDETTR